MNRHDIRQLQQIKRYPSLTLTIPTHRTAPANQQDPIRLKNVVRSAAARLLDEFGKREAEPLLIRLDHLVERVNFRQSMDGLAVFVNHDFGQTFHLPFALKERVVIDETFFTRDLVFALNRTPRYWVLALSEKPTRLFQATRHGLSEIEEGGFPMFHEGPGGEEPLPGGYGIEKSSYRDERHRQFFRKVDAALKPFLAADPLPMVVVGVDRFLSFFSEVSGHREVVLTTVTGSHDKTSPHELGKLIWPEVKSRFAEERDKVMDELGRAISERKLVSTVGEVWRLAHEGRGRLLLVEEDFHFPARVDATGMHITPAEDSTSPDVIDDAVDEIIETVLDKQGRVQFVDNGKLKDHQRIALLLRY